MQKKFDLNSNGDFKTFDSFMKEALTNVPNNRDGLLHLHSSDLYFGNILTDILTEPVFYRAKKKYFNTPKRYNYFSLVTRRLKLLFACIAVLGTLSDYIFDSQLVYTFYVSWEVTVDTGFPLKEHFYNIFIFLSVILVTSHAVNTLILAATIRFDTSGILSKFFFCVTMLCYPVFYVISSATSEIRFVIWPSSNVDTFVDEEVIRHQYAFTVNEQKVFENCFENIPQLFLVILLSLSNPLYGKVKPILGITFFLFKGATQFFSFSVQLVKFMNFQRNGIIEIVGQIILAISSYSFIISRMFSVMFCMMLSSYYPDLPYFLFYSAKILEVDSNVHIEYEEFTPPLNPTFMKSISSIAISAKPFYLCLSILLISNIIYFVCMNQIFAICKVKPNLRSQLLSAVINSYCPIKQPMKFSCRDPKMNSYYQRRALLLVLVIYSLTTILIILVPFLCYGTHLFTEGLPMLDELMRYNALLFKTERLPSQFPSALPWHLHKCHLLFPGVAAGGLVTGIALFLAYQRCGRPGKGFSFQDKRRIHIVYQNPLFSRLN